jgi:hypothetical protein
MAQPAKRLTRAMAQKIIDAVSIDPSCKKLVDDLAFSVLPAGWAGGFRNAYDILLNPASIWEGKSLEQLERNCEGITFFTANAIIKNKPPFVSSARDCYRILDGYHHHATAIDLKSFGAVVFDWHATLCIANPVIYRTIVDFQKDNQKDKKGSLGTQFRDFSGC